ncbi:MAG: NACHT domain-containing NTPase [Nostoc sp. DedVER02]|uniref:NACHT domain-containing protein n=1 Tax=unclassified Nostoc TaxID=2593658 RepID=UPI002AD3ABDC|nr:MULTISPECIES: NACHT domain-containing NTPase [unclassified Nostoc]MDZ7989287.1 NACHT domain-containing NTPase [Nostoc sp. DedVER02]MDZ8114367.1 NACHT domain-containing NTPase [Nostoc sp. DedVER01b]
MSIPEDFLKQLEQYSELSHREKEVFLEIFGRSKNRVNVAQELNISESNLGTCLTGIYRKFCITGNGPVKESRLREYLSKRYAQQKPSGDLTTDDIDDSIDTLVQEIRKQIKPYIKEKCGTMRVLDMPQPIELTGKQGIYTNVNILEEITGRTRLKVAELMQSCDYDNFERIGLSRVKQKRVSGLEVVQRHSKLMVLGKPGAGKTTFLKYLAMQCIEGRYQANRVPLFITLKDFAEAPKKPDIFKFIVQLLSSCEVTHASAVVEKLLKQGKAFVLLDGLDEVREEDSKRVLRQIQEFSDFFHTNQFVITCRIAAKEYTYQSFTEVEMADFDEKQIALFAQNWFQLTDPVKSQRFIQKLKENKPIQELASSPLLLTLLCLVFGDSGDFPANRSELYQEGLDILLKKWDAKRNIEREQVYKNLSLQRKEDLLSQIGLTTFEQKDYFFKQKTAEAYIADFIRNLRNADTDPEVLKLDSEAVLKSIEAQHGLLVERAKGIYSFSHLTFHEYFAAREIVANSSWETLLEHITEKRWREVFLLTAGMMRKADDLTLLMKHKIDGLISTDEQLQHFMRWVAKKSSLATVPYPPAEVRGVYLQLMNHLIQGKYSGFPDLARILAFDLALTGTSDNDFYKACGPAGITGIGTPGLSFEVAIFFEIKRMRAGRQSLEIMHPNHFDLNLDFDLERKPSPDLQILLDKLKSQLSSPQNDSKAFHRWWRTNGKVWTEQLRTVMIEHCNIGHDWQINEAQKKLLEQYYYANKLLMNCLNNDCYVSREVRQEIENTLLLPNAN